MSALGATKTASPAFLRLGRALGAPRSAPGMRSHPSLGRAGSGARIRAAPGLSGSSRSFLNQAIFANLLAGGRIRRSRIQIDVVAVIHAPVLGQPDHKIASRLRRPAITGALIAVQLERRL